MRVGHPIHRRTRVTDRRLQKLARDALEIVAVGHQDHADSAIDKRDRVVLGAVVVAGVEDCPTQVPAIEAAPAQTPTLSGSLYMTLFKLPKLDIGDSGGEYGDRTPFAEPSDILS